MAGKATLNQLEMTNKIPERKLSPEELEGLQKEVQRLEALGEDTTLKLSDVSKMIEDLKNANERLKSMEHTNMTLNRLLNRVNEKLYYRKEAYAVEAATIASGASDRYHLNQLDQMYRRMAHIFAQMSNQLDAGKAVDKDSDLGREIRRIKVELQDLAYWENT